MNALSEPDVFAAARPAGHPDIKSGRIGVLIVNLGTPEATDYWSMRRYLKEFLSDRRVIETPRWLWWPILNLAILSRRPSVKGRDYDAIWNKELNESPLKTFTRAQAEKLAPRLGKGSGREIVVDWAMRYGKPAIAERLASLQSQGCDRILLIPLYPQYCAASSATVCDKAFDALKAMRWQPTLRVAAPYFELPAYIDALAISTQASLARLDFEPEVILGLLSRHSEELFRQGRPVFLPLREDDAAAAQQAGDERRQTSPDVPVALWRRQVAGTFHGRNSTGARSQRREADRYHHAGLCGRLPRNARRDRRRKRRLFPRRRRRTIRPPALPER